ncbi:hypothetical protein FA13DRAFT_1784377 [Coprinellus micaceus]|uniref:Uncharacterized protein n=1 Tax=Coprinellus micaceus TaxID=71717 RepID=A0A4Y7U1L1_COPMI|nr:hypothetical protein FA13DRAFT_1784377 [Coprinellus micaceus]
MDESPSVLVTEKKTLEAQFTTTQLQYLRSRAPDYKATSLKLRSHISREAADYLIKGAVAAGEKFEAKDLKAILANVRLWFSQRCRKRKAIPRWTHHWMGRQVFYKAHASKVALTQRRLYQEATEDLVGEELEEFKEEFNIDMAGDETTPEEEENVVPDGERNRVIGMGTGKGAGAGMGESTGTGQEAGTDTKNTPSSKKPQLFDFFQKALSLEYVKLTDKERGIFEKQALDWQKSGPDGEEKKRAAEKYVALWIDQFAQDIFTQFGAQICVFLSYQDSADTHNIKTITLGQEPSSSVGLAQHSKGLGCLERWGQYTTNLLPSVTLPDASVGNLIDLPLKGRAEWLAPEASIASVPDGYSPYVYFAKVT